MSSRKGQKFPFSLDLRRPSGHGGALESYTRVEYKNAFVKDGVEMAPWFWSGVGARRLARGSVPAPRSRRRLLR